MHDKQWGAGTRAATRPAMLSAGLGLAAFAIAFFGALLLGRGVTGTALAALVIPLALSGAVAVGLVVGFAVAAAVEVPSAAAQASRALAAAAPLAALVALFAYAAGPAAPLPPSFGAPETSAPGFAAPPRRVVAVPPAVAGVRVVEPPARPVRHVATAHPAAAVAVPAATPAPSLSPRPEVVPPLVPATLTGRCWQPGPRLGRNPHSLAACQARGKD